MFPHSITLAFFKTCGRLKTGMYSFEMTKQNGQSNIRYITAARFYSLVVKNNEQSSVNSHNLNVQPGDIRQIFLSIKMPAKTLILTAKVLYLFKYRFENSKKWKSPTASNLSLHLKEFLMVFLSHDAFYIFILLLGCLRFNIFVVSSWTCLCVHAKSKCFCGHVHSYTFFSYYEVTIFSSFHYSCTYYYKNVLYI